MLHRTVRPLDFPIDSDGNALPAAMPSNKSALSRPHRVGHPGRPMPRSGFSARERRQPTVWRRFMFQAAVSLDMRREKEINQGFPSPGVWAAIQAPQWAPPHAGSGQETLT